MVLQCPRRDPLALASLRRPSWDRSPPRCPMTRPCRRRSLPPDTSSFGCSATPEVLRLTFQGVAVVAVLRDQLPDLRDRQAEFARDIAYFVFLIAAHAASILVSELVLIVSHDRASTRWMATWF